MRSDFTIPGQQLTRCGFSKLDPCGFIGGFDRLGIACVHGDAPNPHNAGVGSDSAAASNRGAETQSNSSPVLPSFGSAALDFAVALVARLARQFSDRPARDRWSAMWGYRSRGRWRGGRPRVHSEIRHLIARMASENFLWGAPRIHGELLMLGFGVSQATVSRYMPARSRRPEQSWRTFLRTQAMAFGHCEYSEEWRSGKA